MRAYRRVHCDLSCGAAAILAAAVVLFLLAWPSELLAQSGAIGGRVSDRATGEPVAGAVVGLAGTNQTTQTGADGRYRLRQVRPGRYTVIYRAFGYQPVDREMVVVASGQTVTINVELLGAIELPEIAAASESDRLLDPTVTQTIQRVSAQELRELPITTIEDALVLQAGAVGGSFRGGRLGQESFVIDGLNVKNQLDASTSSFGLNIPTFALEEANLITNAFSARYGQALSGIVTLVTRDGGDEIEGHVAYETDRPLSNGWDYGLDRMTASLGGPLVGGVRFFLSADTRARLDDDPVNAPVPTDSYDPRSESPWLLPHNSGEHYDVMAKLTVPAGPHTFRLMGVASENNNLLYEPELKYTSNGGPAQNGSGRLGLFHWQVNSGGGPNNTAADLRVGFFEKQSTRGVLRTDPELRFGGFTFSGFEFAGQDIASGQDSIRALEAIPGYSVPRYAPDSPWGVPGFFLTDATTGELAHTEFRELKIQGDVVFGRGLDTDWRIGGQYVRQQVETFSRFQSYLAVSDGGAEPKISRFNPFAVAGYLEVVQRVEELSLTAGVRVDGFNGRGGVESGRLNTQWAVSPRFALSTELGRATVIASFGRFAQAPDFQYLVDAAFDDTLRTGRSRVGNPNLGFETSWQYEFSVRMRPNNVTGVRVGAFVKQLDGLVASVPIGIDPDSSIFGNADYGTVMGLEVTVEREFRRGVGARATAVLQKAEATATSAFDAFRQPVVGPDGVTVIDQPPQKIPLDYDRRLTLIGVVRARTPDRFGSVLRGMEAAIVGKFGTGLPFTRAIGLDTNVVIIPNGERLPRSFTLDLLLRRTVPLGGNSIDIYFDARNLTNRRNVISVRRDTGSPDPGELQIDALAQEAYLEHPDPIPYESPRYDPAFDLNGDGLISGTTELLQVYRRAAQDFLQPIFAYGPPRQVKFGAEIRF